MQTLRNWQLPLTASRNSPSWKCHHALRKLKKPPRRGVHREKAGCLLIDNLHQLANQVNPPSWSGSFNANWAALSGLCSSHGFVNQINDCCFEQHIFMVIHHTTINDQNMLFTESLKVIESHSQSTTNAPTPVWTRISSLLFVVLHSQKLKQALSKQGVFKWLSHWLGSQGLIFLWNLISLSNAVLVNEPISS